MWQSGKLDETVEIIIEEGAKLFVSAVGVPPKHVVERFHKAGIPVRRVAWSERAEKLTTRDRWPTLWASRTRPKRRSSSAST